jgi:hypothetical protein
LVILNIIEQFYKKRSEYFLMMYLVGVIFAA